MTENYRDNPGAFLIQATYDKDVRFDSIIIQDVVDDGELIEEGSRPAQMDKWFDFCANEWGEGSWYLMCTDYLVAIIERDI